MRMLLSAEIFHISAYVSIKNRHKINFHTIFFFILQVGKKGIHHFTLQVKNSASDHNGMLPSDFNYCCENQKCVFAVDVGVKTKQIKQKNKQTKR